jgi:hypothetical protein
LSNDPLNENNTQVYIDGVYQNKDTYSVSGTTLTFSTAPPNGSAVEAMTIQPTAVNVPADASVTSAKLSGDLVTPGALDVTGTVTADGLSIDSGSTNTQLTLARSTTHSGISFSTQISDFGGGGADLIFDGSGNSAGFGFRPTNSSGTLQTGLIISPDGNVGIGTTSPTSRLQLDGAEDRTGGLTLSAGGQNHTYFLSSDFVNVHNIETSSSAAAHTWQTNGTERMRLDASGNLIVGKTVTSSSTAGMLIGSNGRFDAVRDGGYVGYFNRLSSDGDIALFAKDGTTVGSIGSIAGGYLSISGTTGGRLQINGTDEYAWDTTQFYPANDNANDLGFITKRWDDVYATNGTIQTSDRNEKQDIEALSDAEQRVAVAAKGLLRKFRWISSVEENGDDARIHFGIIAQDLQDAFTAEGLDAGRYAMFTSNTWTDEDTGEERTRLGVRYSELLAFIISAI